MTAEAADVSGLDGEAATGLTLDGEIEGFGVGGLELVVEAPGDGEVALTARSRGTSVSVERFRCLNGRKVWRSRKRGEADVCVVDDAERRPDC